MFKCFLNFFIVNPTAPNVVLLSREYSHSISKRICVMHKRLEKHLQLCVSSLSTRKFHAHNININGQNIIGQ